MREYVVLCALGMIVPPEYGTTRVRGELQKFAEQRAEHSAPIANVERVGGHGIQNGE
jgi:hypothetical protein